MRTCNSRSSSVHVRELCTVICYLALQGSTRRPSTAQCPTLPHTSSPEGVRWEEEDGEGIHIKSHYMTW